MVIDDITYKLPFNNYFSMVNKKKQIVIGHTFNNNMKHIIGWLHRYNGEYKKTAPFTIDISGVIYKHFEPKYQSKFFNDLELDSKTIVILLENDGCLLKDTKKNNYINWIGDIYKKPNEVIEKKWRGCNYWAPYNEKQLDSVVSLVKKLCYEFSIPMESISHNTKIENLENYEGVLYKSNLEKHYNDLSPSWDFMEFKNKLEVN